METWEQGKTKTPGLEEFLENKKLTIGIFVLGIILLGAGVLGFKIFEFSGNQPKVEILGESDSPITSSNNPLISSIVAEVAGEVVKPGVYKLAIGSRVNDLLITAGGLSANADRDWVAKNINMAQKLSDGVKIYIPSETQNANLKEPASRNSFGIQNENANLKTNETKININTASESELDTLWGVGPATAKKIIEGRQYQRTEELLEKKIVKSNVWSEIKDKIAVY